MRPGSGADRLSHAGLPARAIAREAPHPRRRQGQAFQESAQIQPRSSGHNRQMATLPDLFEGNARRTSVISRCRWLIRIEEVERMMRNAGALSGR